MYKPIRCTNRTSVPTKQDSGDSDSYRILQDQKQKLLQNSGAPDISADLGFIGASSEKGASAEKGAPIKPRSPVSVGAPVKKSR